VSDLEEVVAVIRPGGPLDKFDRRRCRARAMQQFSRARLGLEDERVYASAVGPVGRSRCLPTTVA